MNVLTSESHFEARFLLVTTSLLEGNVSQCQKENVNNKRNLEA
jgi:hypothetical protein